MNNQAIHTLPWRSSSKVKPSTVAKEESLLAVSVAHQKEIEEISRYLSFSQSVLVLCEKSLSKPIFSKLGEDARLSIQKLVLEDSPEPSTSIAIQLADRLSVQIGEAFEGNHILAISHLDLIAASSEHVTRPELNNVIYWLSEFPSVTILAFWDPFYPVPGIIENFFSHQVSLQHFDRELIWKLISKKEAKKISCGEHLSIASQQKLYQYFAGRTVIELRRVLRTIMDPELGFSDLDYAETDNDCLESEAGKEVFHFIRTQISAHHTHLDEVMREIPGYQFLQEELELKIIKPMRIRNAPPSLHALKIADRLIPRGLILHGPAGTGKTQWAKWLSRAINATLTIVNGPELKGKYVGETEERIRKIFARARRTAPSVILMDEIDALTPRREGSESNFEASMVAQFLTEMDGLHKNETILIIGTTNRIHAVDRAFLRPGRFGMLFEVGYPDAEARRAILDYYFKEHGFLSEVEEEALREKAISTLVSLTEGPLDKEELENREKYMYAHIRHRNLSDFLEDAGPLMQQKLEQEFQLNSVRRFSGDHLRAICDYLLRETAYNGKDIKQESLMIEAVEAIRKNHSF